METPMIFGILTVSDSSSKSQREDLSGPLLKKEVITAFPKSHIIEGIVPDEQPIIEKTLTEWSSKCNVILTTGGTGFAPRDVTPEATRAVIDKEAPGLSYAMISKSLEVTPMAMLSRAICGIKSNCLIINLPGKPKGAVECFLFIKGCIPHAIAVMTDNLVEVKKAHNDAPDEVMLPSKVKVNVVTRPRKSSYPMWDVEDAVDKIFSEILPCYKTETVSLSDSLDRILSEDIFSPNPIPAFPTSIKDGYAVRSCDKEVNRNVRDVVGAGDKPMVNELQCNEAIRINTGGSVPPGADAVIPVEDTELIEASADGTEERVISVRCQPKIGQDIRQVGSDVAKDSLVLEKSHKITAAHIGIMVSLGIKSVNVYTHFPVGILSTGNELKKPYENLEPGQICDSNKATLMTLLRRYGCSTAVDCGIVKDCATDLKKTFLNLFKEFDIIITTGGVSMGEFDIVKSVLEQDFNAEIHFARVNMKPGKPTTFATLNFNNKKKFVFGLPGNPASASVTCLLFVIPVLRLLENRKSFKFPKVSVKLNHVVANRDSRPEYLRVHGHTIYNQIIGESTGKQISSRLNSMVNANCLVLVPPNYTNANNLDANFTGILIDDLSNFS